MESYISYCNECKKDICVLCLKEHNEHKLIPYGDIMPEIETPEKELNKLKESIEEIKKNINEIFLKLNKLMENLDDYYNIYNEIIKNYDAKKRNYYIIKNTNEINNYNIDFINILKTISNDKNIKSKLKNITHLLNIMTSKEEINDNKEDKGNFLVNNYHYKSKIKFTTDYCVDKIMPLNDGRILTYQRYNDEQDKNKWKVCIYNFNYDFVICDVSMEYDEFPGKIIQMGDNNIIQVGDISKGEFLKVIKIKKNTLEEIQALKIAQFGVYKLSNEKILVHCLDDFKIFLYQNGKLSLCQTFPRGNIHFSYDSCQIKDDEIAIYCYKSGIIWDNTFLVFYDVKNNIEIKSLKLGSNSWGWKKICVFNKNRLILSYLQKFIIIDIINRKIINETKIIEGDEELVYINWFMLDENLLAFTIHDGFSLFNIYFYKIFDSNIEEFNTIRLKKNKSFGNMFYKKNLFIIEGKKVIIKKINDY